MSRRGRRRRRAGAGTMSAWSCSRGTSPDVVPVAGGARLTADALPGYVSWPGAVSRGTGLACPPPRRRPLFWLFHVERCRWARSWPGVPAACAQARPHRGRLGPACLLPVLGSYLWGPSPRPGPGPAPYCLRSVTAGMDGQPLFRLFHVERCRWPRPRRPYCLRTLSRSARLPSVVAEEDRSVWSRTRCPRWRARVSRPSPSQSPMWTASLGLPRDTAATTGA